MYNSSSSSIIISSFKSLETHVHKPPVDKEWVKGYDSNRKVEPFRLINNSEDKGTLQYE